MDSVRAMRQTKAATDAEAHLVRKGKGKGAKPVAVPAAMSLVSLVELASANSGNQFRTGKSPLRNFAGMSREYRWSRPEVRAQRARATPIIAFFPPSGGTTSAAAAAAAAKPTMDVLAPYAV